MWWRLMVLVALGCSAEADGRDRYELCGPTEGACRGPYECHPWSSSAVDSCMMPCDELADCERFGPRSFCARRGVCLDRCPAGACPGAATCEEGVCTFGPL